MRARWTSGLSFLVLPLVALAALPLGACSGGGGAGNPDGAAGNGGGGPGGGGNWNGGGSGGGNVTPPVSMMVGTSGGTIELADHARIEIPAGALPADTTITVRPMASSAPLPDGGTPASAAYAFEPHGLTFAAPVTLSLPLPSTANLAYLTVMKLADAQDQTWEWLEGATIDDDRAEVRVTTTSFSIYLAARMPLRYDVLLAQPASTKYVEQGGPLLDEGYVYWSPGDATIKRAALALPTTVETVYRAPDADTVPQPDVILKAVGGGMAYFISSSLLRPVAVPGAAAAPGWVADILWWNTSLRHWVAHGNYLYAGGKRISRATGALIEGESPFGYLDGTAVLAPDRNRAMYWGTEVDFGAGTARPIYEFSQMGASNLGPQTANSTDWFVLDGDKSFEGEWRMVRIPFGGGETQVVASGTKGTSGIQAMANDDWLYLNRDCHDMTFVQLKSPFALKKKDILLTFNGPCFDILKMDATHAYLNSSSGLIRIALEELRR